MKKVRVKIVSHTRFLEDGTFEGCKSMGEFEKDVEDAFNELADAGYQINHRFEEKLSAFVLIGAQPPPQVMVGTMSQLKEVLGLGDEVDTSKLLASKLFDTLAEYIDSRGVSEKEVIENLVNKAPPDPNASSHLHEIAAAWLSMADEHEKMHADDPAHKANCNKPEALRRLATVLKETLQRSVS